jgi:hypothetical protein
MSVSVPNSAPMTSRRLPAASISIDGEDIDLLRSVGARVEVELKPDFMDHTEGRWRLALISKLAELGGKAQLADVVGGSPW